MGREVGGGIGLGKTCEPKAFSFQCMTELTTNKTKQNNNNNNNKNNHFENVKKKKKSPWGEESAHPTLDLESSPLGKHLSTTHVLNH